MSLLLGIGCQNAGKATPQNLKFSSISNRSQGTSPAAASITASMVTEVDGRDIAVRWLGIAGCEDTLEQYDGTNKWLPVFGPVVSVGQSFSIIVGQAPLATGQTASPSAPPVPCYNYTLIVFPNTIIVKMGTNAKPFGENVVTTSSQSWRSLTDLSLDLLEVPANGPNPKYSVLINKRNAFPADVVPPLSNLTAEDQIRLAKLDAAFAVASAANAAPSNIAGGGSPNQTVCLTGLSLGKSRPLRLRRVSLDSDGDHLFDHQELAWKKSSPNNWDSDSNGVSDMLEDWDADGLNTAHEVATAKSPVTKDVAPSKNQVGREDLHLDWTDQLVDGQMRRVVSIRALRGMDHGYRYQLQFRVRGTGLWQDIDSQAFQVGKPVPYASEVYPNSLFPLTETLTFRAPYEQASEATPAIPATATTTYVPPYLNEFIRVRVIPPGFARSLEQTHVTLDGLRDHFNACMQELISAPEVQWTDPAVSPAKPRHSIRDIFERDLSSAYPLNTTYNRLTPNKWNRYSLAARLDFTGVSWDEYVGTDKSKSQAEITLISPLHGIMTRHQRNQGGSHSLTSEVVFEDRIGLRHARKIAKLRQFDWFSNGVSGAGDSVHDMILVTLDRPLPPTVTTYPVLPIKDSSQNMIEWNLRMTGASVLVCSKEREIGIYKMDGLNRITTGQNANVDVFQYVKKIIGLPENLHWRGESTAATEDGDSGGPVFALYKGRMVLLGIIARGYINSNTLLAQATWLGFYGYHNRIIAWMNEDVGSTHQFQTISFQ